MSILVMIPAYNEELNIVRVINELVCKCPSVDYVVINDGSNDRTAQICRQNGYPLIDQPVNLGLAGTFQTGMKYALEKNYDYALQLDGDGQHDPGYVEQMLEVIEQQGADIIIGSRFVTEKKNHSARMVGSRLISNCIKLTTGKRITDPTSGMRMYNRRIIRVIANGLNYGPEPDTIAYLIRCGARVKEIQVTMRERMAGKSYLNVSRSIGYMAMMCSSILLIQWFRRNQL